MNIKSILAAVMAASVCFSMTGCNSSESDDSSKSKNSSVSEKIDKDEKGSKTDDSSVQDGPYSASDEIKDADFSSGLIQVGNDIFKNGGYITVDQLIAQYGDKYDTSGIDPESFIKKKSDMCVNIISKEDPEIIVTVKYNSKIAGDEVDNVRVGDCSIDVFAPANKEFCWYPHGICASGAGNDVDSIKSILEDEEYISIPYSEASGDYLTNYGLYWEENNSRNCFICREQGADKNLYGFNPIYQYTFEYGEDNNISSVTIANFTSFVLFTNDLENYTRLS